jgi:hypothetical protein
MAGKAPHCTLSPPVSDFLHRPTNRGKNSTGRRYCQNDTARWRRAVSGVDKQARTPALRRGLSGWQVGAALFEPRQFLLTQVDVEGRGVDGELGAIGAAH